MVSVRTVCVVATSAVIGFSRSGQATALSQSTSRLTPKTVGKGRLCPLSTPATPDDPPKQNRCQAGGIRLSRSRGQSVSISMAVPLIRMVLECRKPPSPSTYSPGSTLSTMPGWVRRTIETVFFLLDRSFHLMLSQLNSFRPIRAHVCRRNAEQNLTLFSARALIR